jgi:hypothetical protein
VGATSPRGSRTGKCSSWTSRSSNSERQ